jgi:drug/metabolite transporter (DMT)-like permease
MSSLANPVIAILASWVQLGEHPSQAELAGMTLIAVALGILSLRALMVHYEPCPEAGPE